MYGKLQTDTLVHFCLFLSKICKERWLHHICSLNIYRKYLQWAYALGKLNSFMHISTYDSLLMLVVAFNFHCHRELKQYLTSLNLCVFDNMAHWLKSTTFVRSKW